MGHSERNSCDGNPQLRKSKCTNPGTGKLTGVLHIGTGNFDQGLWLESGNSQGWPHEIESTLLGLNMTQLHQTIAAAADKATWTGSAGSVLGWMTSSAFGMWAGIVIGVLGLVVNWYFKRKGDRRSQEAHNAYLETLRATPKILEPQETEE